MSTESTDMSPDAPTLVFTGRQKGRTRFILECVLAWVIVILAGWKVIDILLWVLSCIYKLGR